MGESQRVYQQRSVSQQQQDFCGLVREKEIIVEMLLVVLSEGFYCNTAQQKLVNLLRILQSLLDRQEFLLNHSNAGTGVYSTCCCCHIYLVTCVLDVVEQAAVKEGLNGANGPNIILVFPSLNEGNESGGVQM